MILKVRVAPREGKFVEETLNGESWNPERLPAG
jgi:hypothetical protein